MSAEPTPGPWSVTPLPHGEYRIDGADGEMIAKVFIQDGLYTAAANANLIVANQPILAALRAASGYLLNAKIDLETGATKKAAIATIERGLRVVETALTSA